MKPIRIAHAVPALALVLAACATAPLQPAPEAVEPLSIMAPAAPMLESPGAAAQYHILAGELAASREQPAVAAENFLKALKLVKDGALAARATGLALTAGNEEMALQAARYWLEAEPTSQGAREVIARLSLRQGLNDEAYAQCREIIEGNAAGLTDGYRDVALLLAQEGSKQDAALNLMQRLVDLNPALAGAQYALGLLAFRFGELGIAHSAARDALKIEPDSRDASLLLAGVQVKQGELDDADQTIDALAAKQKDPAAIRLGYAKLLLEANQRERARDQTAKLLEKDPGNADARYALGLMALEDRKPAEAKPHFEALQKSGERKNEAAYYLGRIEELAGNHEAALKMYERVSGGSLAIDAAAHRAATLSKLGRMSEARALLAQLRQQYPQFVVRLYLAEGELLYDAGSYEQALVLYQGTLDQFPDDPDLLYGRSLIYEKQGDLPRAEKDLRRLIELDKADARALNALGYLLTLHSERLEEAQQLITQALEITPDDAAVIDSMGWVEYRRGNLPAAHEWLRKAFDKLPDPEIAAHLGEVLWAMGEKDQARQVWATAMADEPDHKVLRETVDRLTR